MPRGDGTGPTGQGPGTGRGTGMGRGRGGGKMGGTKAGAGTGGQCVCPSCGATVTHQRSTPCFQTTCPKCGAMMLRKYNG